MVRVSLLMLVVLLVQGCATTQQQATVEKLDFNLGKAAIALMPLDVELSLLTASGATEHRAEWTKAAKGFMGEEMTRYFNTKEVDLVDGSDIQGKKLVDLLSLHEVVGGTILYHHYVLPLPTKGWDLDWTLGDEAAALRKRLNADYGLFVYIRDSYSSGGRIALQVLGSIVGAGVQGGMQVGFASLVDLRNGQVVWFNRLISQSGDLRKEAPAAKTVANLLDGFPL